MEHRITITTADGPMHAFVAGPDGGGRHPGMLVCQEAFSVNAQHSRCVQAPCCSGLRRSPSSFIERVGARAGLLRLLRSCLLCEATNATLVTDCSRRSRGRGRKLCGSIARRRHRFLRGRLRDRPRGRADRRERLRRVLRRRDVHARPSIALTRCWTMRNAFPRDLALLRRGRSSIPSADVDASATASPRLADARHWCLRGRATRSRATPPCSTNRRPRRRRRPSTG